MYSATQMYLIEGPISEIVGEKLPSKRQILQYMSFACPIKRDHYQAAKATFNVIEPLWIQSMLPTMTDHNSAVKIKKFFESYQKLYRSSRNKSEYHTELFKGREKAFVDELDDLFDITSTDLSNVSDAAKNFLSQQRLKGRPGTIPKAPEDESFERDELEESALALVEGISRVVSDISSSVLSSSSSMVSHSRDDPDFDPSLYETPSAPLSPPITLNKRFISER